MDSTTPPTTRLLTLLNVSAVKPNKRSRLERAPNYHRVLQKAQKATKLVMSAATKDSSSESAAAGVQANGHSQAKSVAAQHVEKLPTPAGPDAFDVHFGAEGALSKTVQALPPAPASSSTDSYSPWELTSAKESIPMIGDCVHLRPRAGEGTELAQVIEAQSKTATKPLAAFEAYRPKSRKRKSAPHPTPTHKAVIPLLATYADLMHTFVTTENREEMREAAALHAMSHVEKTRRLVLKNNERVAKAAANPNITDVDLDVRDQGFTRPKVLVLVPMRNSAKSWVKLLCALSGVGFSVNNQDEKTAGAASGQAPPPENLQRFEKEYSLPDSAVDKLAIAGSSSTPISRFATALDHVETFAGNIDDSFTLGLKVTRKCVKLYSRFYDSDVIVASPLGLRMAIEKDRDSDFLSSIEILIADQMDVMMMQNWDHVQVVLSSLNRIPKQSHDTDFSRVKQWYLDGKAPLFRQSILFSAYDAPELRALFSRDLLNGSGKRRTTHHSEGVLDQVASGVRILFTRFDVANLHAEADFRFQHFTTKTLPNLLKSALSSSRTLILVPSYFDFVRLEEHLRNLEASGVTGPDGGEGVSFASISEYSSNRDISRARQSFFAGRKSFLVVTERFHFYRRYLLRGARTLIFYAPPEHAHYFAELLTTPFAPSASTSRGNKATAGKKRKGGDEDGIAEELVEEDEVDPSEVSTQVLFSKYDALRLERIVGTVQAKRMISEPKTTWRFA